MTNFQIGAQMYSVRDHCQEAGEMLQTMKALKAMGYNTCQLSGQNRAIPAEQLKDMLDESGLTCACTHISFQEMEEDLDKVIRFHKTLGCEYPGIGGLPGEYRASPEGFVTFAEKASKIADKAGITRSVIVNALRKFESAGVIESRSSGMKGTYIKVLNSAVYRELDSLREKIV